MLSLMPLLTLYAATSNPGKLAEFKSAALAEGVAIEALPNLHQIPEPTENATTFQGNADIKAIAYSLAAPNLLVFADDSGLEVPALHNQPGVRSARFADDYLLDHPDNAVISTEAHQPNPVISTRAQHPNPVISTEAQRSGETPVLRGTTDARNNALLLHLMQQEPHRAARFVCNLALARNGQILLRAHGTVEGELLHAPRGADGFGYDPLFLLPSLNLTSAEIPRDQKWQLSHRGNAFRSLLAQLATANL
jgi:XTP/dITP diphosphohydrolase